MDNVNEALLNRKKLDGTPEDENAAAKRMRAETAEARNGGNGALADGGTPTQVLSQARNSADQATEQKKETGSSPIAAASAKGLRMYWLNILDSFGGTLILINLHVFGHSVFGEKIFCQLGEEWIPENLRSNLESPQVKKMIQAFALLDKIGLIFLDLIALIALLALIVFIVILVSFLNGSALVKAWTILKSIFQSR